MADRFGEASQKRHHVVATEPSHHVVSYLPHAMGGRGCFIEENLRIRVSRFDADVSPICSDDLSQRSSENFRIETSGNKIRPRFARLQNACHKSESNRHTLEPYRQADERLACLLKTA